MALAKTTVVCTFPRPDGTGFGQGKVTLTPTAWVQDVAGNERVPPLPIPTSVDETTGGISQELFVLNDDPAADPPGVAYLVREEIIGAPVNTYTVQLPYTAAGGTVDLTSLTHMQAAPALIAYLTAAEASTTYAARDFDWVTGKTYAAGDLVVDSDTIYRAVDDHTAGATFAGDLAAHWTAIGTALPDQTGNGGQFLTTDGEVATWAGLPPTIGSQVWAKADTSTGTGTPWRAPAAGSVLHLNLQDSTGSLASTAPADLTFLPGDLINVDDSGSGTDWIVNLTKNGATIATLTAAAHTLDGSEVAQMDFSL